MTVLAWAAVLGPIGAAATGILVGYFIGKLSNAEEIGELGERCANLEQQLRTARGSLASLAAAPPSRRESGRVLDLVTGPGAA
jgi:hypothetical protein